MGRQAQRAVQEQLEALVAEEVCQRAVTTNIAHTATAESTVGACHHSCNKGGTFQLLRLRRDWLPCPPPPLPTKNTTKEGQATSAQPHGDDYPVMTADFPAQWAGENRATNSRYKLLLTKGQ